MIFRRMAPLMVALILAMAGNGASAQMENSDACVQEFGALKAQADKQEQLIRDSRGRQVPPKEACKLTIDFNRAQHKMIGYLASHATTCGLPPVTDESRRAYRASMAAVREICSAARNVQERGPTGDFWPGLKIN